jgi:hypothetical protein
MQSGKEWTRSSKTSGCGCFATRKVEKGGLGKETLNLFDSCKLSTVNEVMKGDDWMARRSWHMYTEAAQQSKVAETVAPEHDTKLCIDARTYQGSALSCRMSLDAFH